MLQPKARWTIGETDDKLADRFAAELGVDRLLARLLVARGFHDPAEARQFIEPGSGTFHDPYLLHGMEAAVSRIRLALTHGEKLRIYGDYDADGVSSTALMIHLLRQLGADFDYYIPHRVAEGYGMNRAALEQAKIKGVSLIVTVDTGISARDEVEYARELGIDVVVTDHHEPPELLPDACAVVNPKQPGCTYPFKQLAGVGVAFKLAQALLERVPEELLEIATIGTVADLMPLQGENRLIVRRGLERMRQTPNAGIRALLEVAGVERRDVTATHVGFTLAPRINASGRLESADDAVKLLTTENEQEAGHIACELDSLNKERQRIVEEMTKEALELAVVRSTPRIIVIAKENWNVGVIGIVASKLLDRFYCPTVILGIDPASGMAKGSARSIAGFDIYQALNRCGDLLDHYGGHQAAAGMSLHSDNIQPLAERLQQLADEWLTEEDFTPVVQADLACSLEEAPLEAIRQLERLAPFGMGNPAPRFVFTGLQLSDMRTMGKEQQHLKLALLQGALETACSIEAVGFGRGHLTGRISPSARLDVLGELSVNEWNGVRKPQIMIHDLRVPHAQLFDWRGHRDVEKKWLDVLERHRSPAGPSGKAGCLNGDEEAAPGILLFADPEQELLPPSFQATGCAVWLYSQTGGIRPLSRAAAASEFPKTKDLLLASLPPSLDVLEAALREAAEVCRVYAWFQGGRGSGSGEAGLPSRDTFKTAYAAIRKVGSLDLGSEAVVAAFSRRSGLSPAMVRFIMTVFEELRFVERTGTVCRSVAAPERRELTSSKAYEARVRQQDAERLLVYSTSQELQKRLMPHIGKGESLASGQ